MTNRDLKHEEVINNILENRMNGLVYLPSGYGKTRIALKALERSSFKNILWVCGSEEFRDNGLWEECDKWGIKKSVCKSIDTICYQSLSKTKTSRYSIVILDEIQYITPLRARPLYHHTDTKILGLTGTPPRDNIKQEIFNDLGLNIITQKTVDDGVDEEMISDYEIDIVFTQMSNEKNIAKTFNNNTFYVSEKSTYSYYNNKLNQAYEIGSKDISRLTLNRARFLYNLESKLICAKKIMHKYKDKRIISFSKSIDHAKILGKTAYHSKLNKKEKEHNLNLFNSKKVDSVGTVEAANTSINFIDLDIVVVHQLDSNPGNFLQRIGRNLRYKKDAIKKMIILCTKDTQDVIWVRKCIEGLNKNKIKYYEIENYV